MQGIIDSHFHIWQQKDLPWLSGPPAPRIFGTYDAIRRDYPIEEFLADRAGSGIAKAIYVQTNWPNEDFEKEAAWIHQVAKASGWPQAMVAYADMAVDDVRPQLDRLRLYPLVRGVRMQMHWHENPQYRFAPNANQFIDRNVRANIARLKDYGYSFDLQLFPGQMREGARLVEENPKIDFILPHAGMLVDLSPEETETWCDGLRRFSRLPNLYAKLSGLGTFVHRNDRELIGYVVDHAIDILGSARLMFGSNFPIEKLWTTYAELVSVHRDAVAGHGAQAEADIFWNTASRVYRV